MIEGHLEAEQGDRGDSHESVGGQLRTDNAEKAAAHSTTTRMKVLEIWQRTHPRAKLLTPWTFPVRCRHHQYSSRLIQHQNWRGFHPQREKR